MKIKLSMIKNINVIAHYSLAPHTQLAPFNEKKNSYRGVPETRGLPFVICSKVRKCDQRKKLNIYIC